MATVSDRLTWTEDDDRVAHRVLVFGWTFTGRVLIAAWGCGDAECAAEARGVR